jgi:hypothetical protein
MKAERTVSVASDPLAAYFPAMFAARLVRLFVLLALVLAPLAMTGAHPAMAMPAHAPAASGHHAMGADHCAGMDQPARPQPVSCIDCIMVCSALPALESEILAHPIDQREQRVLGLHPESEPPPPRVA